MVDNSGAVKSHKFDTVLGDREKSHETYRDMVSEIFRWATTKYVDFYVRIIFGARMTEVLPNYHHRLSCLYGAVRDFLVEHP